MLFGYTRLRAYRSAFWGHRSPLSVEGVGRGISAALHFLTGVRFLYYSENFGLRWRLQVGSGTFFVVLWQMGLLAVNCFIEICVRVPRFLVSTLGWSTYPSREKASTWHPVEALNSLPVRHHLWLDGSVFLWLWFLVESRTTFAINMGVFSKGQTLDTNRTLKRFYFQDLTLQIVYAILLKVH